jgi:hypothetical protein
MRLLTVKENRVMEQKVIDFRCRPPYKDFLKGLQYAGGASKDNARWGDKDSRPLQEKTMESMIREMDEANVQYAVAASRESDGVSNQTVLDLIHEYPDRFIGLCSIPGNNPFSYGIDKAIGVIDELVVHGPMSGVVLEPGIVPSPEHSWFVNDERIFPLYEFCQEKGVLVNFTWGLYGAKRYMEVYKPEFMFDVARKFPEMTIVLSHVGWPYVFETIAMGLTEKNVYLNVDDMLVAFQPGYEMYVNAINNPNLRGKTLFASAFPIGGGLSVAVKRVSDLGVKPEYFPDFMYNTAAKLLGLKK